MTGEYAAAGVDPAKIKPFKIMMSEVAQATMGIPLQRRNVRVRGDVQNPHGAVWQYVGRSPHVWIGTEEILGHLSWIAEEMYRSTGISYHERIARAAGLIIAVDVIAHGALPCVWLDSIQASSSDWFHDALRASDYARGCRVLCEEIGVALPQGESGVMRYLVRPEPPVTEAAAFSGAMIGIVAPSSRLICGERHPGLRILGVPSSSLHANGSSLLIRLARKLPRGFLTKIGGGRTLGEEALVPMRSYVALVEGLLKADIPIAEILPGTGDGLAKLLADPRPLTYRIEQWPAVLPLFRFLREEFNLPLAECLSTFNWGVGLYLFVHRDAVPLVTRIGADHDYEVLDLGVVESGERKVIFEPEGVELLA